MPQYHNAQPLHQCQMMQLGSHHKFEGNKKNSVTHLPRHLLAIEAKSIDTGGEVISDALRHKSSKSKVYYEKER